eukprot:CAMPEP_0176048878 /NCGR_PEP_ID=MMETSP0120_2-20121206/24283_1 /TAXON_ID=160619 /ORGANISM="Kryptoperidinium foliaceum, Strain CCMP 1326" /LENGTH=287 /DNA_ID=CAMNT_0017382299 /DNA_START=79 /DNA_END=940 /DNA_ORIENTATION=+
MALPKPMKAMKAMKTPRKPSKIAKGRDQVSTDPCAAVGVLASHPQASTPMALPKPMKAVKAKGGVGRPKKPSKIAKGRMAKALVLRGSREKTSGGLKKEALMKNKRGKVVSKRQSALGKLRYKNIEGWTDCFMEARRALHITGFVVVNGKTLQGKALYVKAKALFSRGRKVVEEPSAPDEAQAVVAGLEPRKVKKTSGADRLSRGKRLSRRVPLRVACHRARFVWQRSAVRRRARCGQRRTVGRLAHQLFCRLLTRKGKGSAEHELRDDLAEGGPRGHADGPSVQLG